MKKLAWITVGLTYCLMVWGNLVSSTGSGLACPDWPLCHGTITPPVSFAVVLEWGHRVLAFTTSIFILLTIIKVFQTPKKNVQLQRSGTVLFLLLLMQIILGGATVLVGLSPIISTIHLLVATAVFSGLITVACVVTWKSPVVQPNSPHTSKLRRLAQAGLGALILQLALGGLVRHTHSGLACPNFPTCLDSIFPIPFTFETGIAFFHRWLGIIMLGLFLHLALTAARAKSELAGPTRRAFSLSVAQVLLGVGTVLSGINVSSRAIHAAVGYALWGILFYIAIRSGGVRWFWDRNTSSR